MYEKMFAIHRTDSEILTECMKINMTKLFPKDKLSECLPKAICTQHFGWITTMGLFYWVTSWAEQSHQHPYTHFLSLTLRDCIKLLYSDQFMN